MIQLSGVCKQFGSLPVLNNINLSVEKGEKIAIIGASGCGKSTLLRCINGLEAVDQGAISVNHTDLHEKSTNINHYRANIGMVFQE